MKVEKGDPVIDRRKAVTRKGKKTYFCVPRRSAPFEPQTNHFAYSRFHASRHIHMHHFFDLFAKHLIVFLLLLQILFIPQPWTV